jgi:hypothetical protein
MNKTVLKDIEHHCEVSYSSNSIGLQKKLGLLHTLTPNVLKPLRNPALTTKTDVRIL